MKKRGTRAVMVRNRSEAVEAMRAAAMSGNSLMIVSPPGAALFAGPIWFRALIRATRAESGVDADVIFVLDCGDAPGAALAAIRARVEAIAFRGTRSVRARLAAIARRAGVAMHVPPANAFDMTRNRGSEALLAWFSSPRASLQSLRRSAKRTATRSPAPKARSRAKNSSTGVNRP
jgi:hypothetical protein